MPSLKISLQALSLNFVVLPTVARVSQSHSHGSELSVPNHPTVQMSRNPLAGILSHPLFFVKSFYSLIRGACESHSAKGIKPLPFRSSVSRTNHNDHQYPHACRGANNSLTDTPSLPVYCNWPGNRATLHQMHGEAKADNAQCSIIGLSLSEMDLLEKDTSLVYRRIFFSGITAAPCSGEVAEK